MMEINQLKTTALNKVKSGKYQQAVTDLTQLIEKVKATSDDRIAIKVLAFSQRSYCNIMLKKLEEASEDIEQAIELAESARKIKDIENMSQEQREQDSIIPLLVESIARRGNILDLQDNCLAALQDYGYAMSILKTKEIKSAYDKLLKSCGIVQLKRNNDKLKIFIDVLDNILNRDELLNKLDDLIKFFAKENKITAGDIEFFASSKAINVPDGVITIYVKDREVVLRCLKAILAIGSKQCLPIYAFFEDVQDCIAHYPEDKEIVTVALSILANTPEEAFNKFATDDAIDTIIDTFKLELPQEVEEKIFFVLFNLANNNEKTTAVCNNPLVFETIVKKQNLGAAILMSRLQQIKDFSIDAMKKMGIAWMTKLLDVSIPIEKLSCVLIAVTRALLYMEEVEGIDCAKEATDAIAKIIPIVSKYLKSSDIASNAFAALTLCCQYCPEQIRKARTLRIASMALTIHAGVENAVQNIISFIYECSVSDLMDEIKAIPTIIPSVLAIVQQHPTKEAICERAIAVSVKADHPAKRELLIAGLKQFPTSKILKDLCAETLDLKA